MVQMVSREEQKWIQDAKKTSETIFEQEKRRAGVGAKLDLEVTRAVWGPPMIGKYVYGEAFPFEKPPRVKVEVFAPEASEREIRGTIRHELVHVKYPRRQEPYDYPGKERESQLRRKLPRTRAKSRLAERLLKGY